MLFKKLPRNPRAFAVAALGICLVSCVVVMAAAQTAAFFTIERQTISESGETYVYRMIDSQLGVVCYYRHTSRLPPTTLGCVKYKETGNARIQRP